MLDHLASDVSPAAFWLPAKLLVDLVVRPQKMRYFSWPEVLWIDRKESLASFNIYQFLVNSDTLPGRFEVERVKDLFCEVAHSHGFRSSQNIDRELRVERAALMVLDDHVKGLTVVSAVAPIAVCVHVSHSYGDDFLSAHLLKLHSGRVC